MTEHLPAKLMLVVSAAVGFVASTIPTEITGIESWAKEGVAGLALVSLVITLTYLIPRLSRDHKEAHLAVCATHERTIDRICGSHAASVREMRSEQREDGRELGGKLDRLSSSVDAMKEAYHEDSRLRLLGIEEIKKRGNQP
jgi:hypothetical protein